MAETQNNMPTIDIENCDGNRETEDIIDVLNPSSDLLLRVDNHTGLCSLITMICSPGWIHKPRLHHMYSDIPSTHRLLIYNVISTYTDDDVVYYISRAEEHRLKHASLVDMRDNEGIDDDDMRPKSFDGTPKRRTKRQNFLLKNGSAV